MPRSGPRETERHTVLPAQSIGSPTAGRLKGASRVVSGESLAIREPGRAPWGLPELVDLLDRSARRVRARYPGSVLLVGDLSFARGGPIDGHLSHESGRDADVGFYFVDGHGKAQSPNRFLRVEYDGHVHQQPGLSFDDRRNWALVQAWVTDPKARIQHIFVAEPLRSRLLAYARRRGVYLPLLHRAALALKQPTRGLSHDDHFHVRIACPTSQNGECLAEPVSRRIKHSASHRPRPRKLALLRAPSHTSKSTQRPRS